MIFECRTNDKKTSLSHTFFSHSTSSGRHTGGFHPLVHPLPPHRNVKKQARFFTFSEAILKNTYFQAFPFRLA